MTTAIESPIPGDPQPRQPQRTTCGDTGLALIRASGQSTTRIAKSSYGPLNPVLREAVGGDPREWGRYDVAGHRTIYSASPAEAAYAESLAVYRPAASLQNLTLGDLFDDEANPNATLAAAVADEWNQRFHTHPGYVAAAWRNERLEYKLRLPPAGWVVDVEHSRTLATLNGALQDKFARLLPGGRSHLTTGDLAGENRTLTTLVGQWIRSQVLEDGSLPHGITYHSKHGTNWRCWAIWLRIVDDGADPTKDVLRELTVAGPGAEIKPPERNSSLRRVADLFCLQIN